MQLKKPLFPCPCCGYLVFEEGPGSYAHCPICEWRDDVSQLRFARTSGANHVSLIEAQANFARFGVSDLSRQHRARRPNESEQRDPAWRPLDVAKDEIEEPIEGVEYGLTYPKDMTELYYWRR